MSGTSPKVSERLEDTREEEKKDEDCEIIEVRKSQKSTTDKDSIAVNSDQIVTLYILYAYLANCDIVQNRCCALDFVNYRLFRPFDIRYTRSNRTVTGDQIVELGRKIIRNTEEKKNMKSFMNMIFINAVLLKAIGFVNNDSDFDKKVVYEHCCVSKLRTEFNRRVLKVM